ncbi:MAG: T9SS type A sorting domain-containing protein, partial [Calditrichia bacterium]
GGAYWAVDNIAFVSTTTTLTDKPDLLPAKFELLPNFPNPFNPLTVIRYRLPVSTRVNISIFNTLGQKVLTLIDDKQAAGSYQIIWEGNNSAGESVASGIYFYRMETTQFSMSRKMLLIR